MQNITAAIQTVLAVLLASLFSRLIGQGYLSPENATTIQNWLMDGVAVAVPVAAAWFTARFFRKETLIKTTNNTDGVLGVAVTPELDRKIEEPTITTPEKLPTEIRKAEIVEKAMSGL